MIPLEKANAARRDWDDRLRKERDMTKEIEMAKQCVVTDEDGNISWSDKTEAAETFKTFAAAEKRAKGLAESTPGRTINIYSLAAEVMAPVSPVVVQRKT